MIGTEGLGFIKEVGRFEACFLEALSSIFVCYTCVLASFAFAFIRCYKACVSHVPLISSKLVVLFGLHSDLIDLLEATYGREGYRDGFLHTSEISVDKLASVPCRQGPTADLHG